MTEPTPPLLDLRQRGWRQGSVLPHGLAVDLSNQLPVGEPLGPEDRIVVISHDCDITHGSIEKEPLAELIVARRISTAPVGDRVFTRSPRLLEFEGYMGDEHGTYRVSAAERMFIPRDRLAGVDPAGALGTEPPDLLVAWLTNRYIRSAFPDAFNERLGPNQRDIKRLLKTGAEHLHSIYIRVDDEELPPETPYRLIVRGTMLQIDFPVPERRLSAQKAFDGLIALLASCEGIEIADEALVSETEISLDDVRLMKRWSTHDSLSLRDERDALPRIDPSH